MRSLDAYLGRLPPDFRYAVELRNTTWLDESLLALLARHRTALVLVDIAYMPHPSRAGAAARPRHDGLRVWAADWRSEGGGGEDEELR